MIITKLQIDSFGGLNRKSIGLSGGINIINGKNESGKLLPAHRNASC